MKAKDYAVRLMKRCKSNDPFTIARLLDILLIYCPLVGLNGFYQYHRRNHIMAFRCLLWVTLEKRGSFR